MDIEGGEYAILRGVDSRLLKRVQRIALEYHDNTAAGQHAELVRRLQANDFHVEVRANPVHDYLGYLYAARK
jgi:Methyltransferase FkbM domain